jgi:hypothetical protein
MANVRSTYVVIVNQPAFNFHKATRVTWITQPSVRYAFWSLIFALEQFKLIKKGELDGAEAQEEVVFFQLTRGTTVYFFRFNKIEGYVIKPPNG